MAHVTHYVRRRAIRKIIFNAPHPFSLYLPEELTTFPLICMTPILGRLLFFDDLLLERRLARFFARSGLAAALIDRPIFQYDPKRGLEQIQQYLEASISRNQSVLDFLMTQKEIRSRAVGSFGISFGAVTNILWAAKDPRLKVNVFALAGGNLPEILVSSRDPLMKSYIQEILRATGLDRNQLKEALEKTLQIDPLQSAASLLREDVFLILALFDRVIRTRCGLALREALGKPKTLFLPLGHYLSLLAIPFVKWQLLDFFKSRLS